MTDTLLHRILEMSSQLEFVEVGADGSVVDANAAFASHVQVPRDRLMGKPMTDLLTAAQGGRLQEWLEGQPPPEDPVRVNFAALDGTPFTLRCLIQRSGSGLRLVGEPEAEADQATVEELMRLNNELATMARERARRERELAHTRDELERTLEELQTSYWHLRKIQEALPICMECGKVKAGEAQWTTVADYLREHEIFLSHGYCPGCAAAYAKRYGLE